MREVMDKHRRIVIGAGRVGFGLASALATVAALAPEAMAAMNPVPAAPAKPTRRQEKDARALAKAQAKRERKAAKRLRDAGVQP